MTMVQALVIGGGVAGSAAAAHLAQAGQEVVLLERKGGPHDKVCGEFISGEAAYYLEQLDINAQSLGAASITNLNLYSDCSVVSAELPFPALSLSRRVLDQTLLESARQRGALVRLGCGVRSLRAKEGGWIAELEDGDSVSAADVFLATGKHELRGWKRPSGWQNDLVAFKLHWRLKPNCVSALSSLVELFLFPGGYAGLSLVEEGIANLCLVIQRRRLAEFDGRWDLLLSALRAQLQPLHATLSGGTPCMDRPLAIASIPYGFVRRTGNGLWCLGDQAAVIPSFSGDGISIALHSARLATQHYLTGRTSAQFQSDLARHVVKQVRVATVLSRTLVHPVGQKIAVGTARLIPGLLRRIAYGTRIPDRRLIKAERESKPTSLSRVAKAR
jgi:menaquinone-9 beta-reductase